MWFFERPNVPDSLKNNESSIDTSTLGIPMGHYPSTGCDIGEFFGKQNLIFDITLCGGELAAFGRLLSFDLILRRFCWGTNIFLADLYGAMLSGLCDGRRKCVWRCVFRGGLCAGF